MKKKLTVAKSIFIESDVDPKKITISEMKKNEYTIYDDNQEFVANVSKKGEKIDITIPKKYSNLSDSFIKILRDLINKK